MHCYEDFPPGFPDEVNSSTSTTRESGGEPAAESGFMHHGEAVNADEFIYPESWLDDGDHPLLDSDGVADNSLTVIVAIVGGLIVGAVATAVLLILTQSALGLLLAIVVWFGTTAHLARLPTVQHAVKQAGFFVAGVLLILPVVLAGVSGGTFGEMIGTFLLTLLSVIVPALFAAAVALVAARHVPDQVE